MSSLFLCAFYFNFYVKDYRTVSLMMNELEESFCINIFNNEEYGLLGCNAMWFRQSLTI
jgi:hypothetical protein